MTIKHKNVDPFDPGIANTMPYRFTVPADNAVLFFSAVSVTTAVAGDKVALAVKWLPIPMSVVFLATDAAGTNLSVTIQITGIDQFGRPAKETLTDTGAAGDVEGSVVFAAIFDVEITAIANKAASDTISLGILGTNVATLYGLPVPILKESTAGVGSERDTVKAVYQNGAYDVTNVSVDVGKAAIKETTAGIAAGVRVEVVLAPPFNHS